MWPLAPPKNTEQSESSIWYKMSFHILRVLFILAISFYLFTLASNFQVHICLNPYLILNLITFSFKGIEPQLLLFGPQWWRLVPVYWSALWSWWLWRGDAPRLLHGCAFRGSRALSFMILMNVQFSSTKSEGFFSLGHWWNRCHSFGFSQQELNEFRWSHPVRLA